MEHLAAFICRTITRRHWRPRCRPAATRSSDSPRHAAPRRPQFGTGGPPTETLLVKPDDLCRKLAGLELLVLEECERWIEEGPYHRGRSAVVQVLGRKPD